MKWTTDKLRQTFLDFFEERGHVIKPGSGLIPSDPSMMFTSAGMVQFKDIFWGRTDPDDPCVATCQKCFRASDIEQVGKTAYHHTFFEMLGNFSFGDYFKKGAIRYGWEFVTQVLNLPEDRLWVSVYHEDDESYDIWRDEIGVPAERIERLGKNENWWGPVGGSGPCGPDSEIFYDAGSELSCGPECEGLACDCNRFNELWNLVFTGYQMDEEGRVEPLENQNIDTGMGLERTAAVLQGVKTDFEIDIFAPLVETVKDKFSIRNPAENQREQIYRIADHFRGAAFLVSEGILPSNEGRGYVLRRVLRRAVRSGSLLGAEAPFLDSLLQPLLDSMGDTYPQLKERRSLIENVLETEEESFQQTLEKGEDLLHDVLEELRDSGKQVVPGERVFRLYDTHGVPPDLVKQLARENGFSVDMSGFEEEMKAQRRRAREELDQDSGVLGSVIDADDKTEFAGYQRDFQQTRILHLIADSDEVQVLREGEKGTAVLRSTPFYAEAGGQVSDQGTLETDGGAGHVDHVWKKDGIYYHDLRVTSGVLATGKSCKASIDTKRRRSVERNHTATHLLHRALQEVLGPHVVQSGSKVAPDELRFDFNHYQPLTEAELREVEDLVNRVIMEDRKVLVKWVEDISAAKELGATAHFEEEYKGKEQLRIVSVERFSRELCGGTHVDRTGEIAGLSFLSSETISSGIRRVRAVTGEGQLGYLREQQDRLSQIAELTGAGEDDLVQRVEAILDQNRELREELEEKTEGLLNMMKNEILSNSVRAGSLNVVHASPDLAPEDLKRLADLLEQEVEGAVLLGSSRGDNASLICKVSEEAQELVGADQVVYRMASVVNGGGGGGPDFAQGGGPDADLVPKALEEGLSYIRSVSGSGRKGKEKGSLKLE
ncbi:MAG: alanine--tRNA ligase [Candidatus Bipolaricaulota bacterium]